MSRHVESTRGREHVDDAAIVRYLDGEGDAADRERLESHVATCVRCRAALEELRAASRRVSRWLPLADEPPETGPEVVPLLSRQRSMPAFVRAAAVLALLIVGLSLAIGPVRARLADWLGLDRAPATTTEERAVPSIPDEAGGVRISFVPEGARFTLSFESSASSGTVTITPVDVARVTGEVTRGEAELQTLPDGLVVRGASGEDVHYRLEVPRTLERVEVRVEGRTVWSGPPAEARIDLSNP